MNDTDEIPELDLETTASSIDRALHDHRRGILTGDEAEASIRGATALFTRFAVVPISELQLIIDYARQAIEELALRPDVMDPVLVEHFDEWLRGVRMTDEVQQRLNVLLERLGGRVRNGDADASADLAELCRTGRHTHRLLLSLNTAANQILHAAYDARCWIGLRDAVSPAYAAAGQIATRESHRGESETALNLLARLAWDPGGGAQARNALLDLAQHIEMTGEAIVRLPLHLLDDDDRARLLETHEQRVRLFGDRRDVVPLSIELLRDNRLVRGAVWQAFDARHLR